jgi:hypothetical protein
MRMALSQQLQQESGKEWILLVKVKKKFIKAFGRKSDYL